VTVSLLEQNSPAAGTEVTLYEVPAGKIAYLASVTMCNASIGTRYVRLAIVKGGGATNVACFLMYDQALPPSITLEWWQSELLALQAGDVIRVYANDVSVAFGVFGREENL
jgi:hypothetical protein